MSRAIHLKVALVVKSPFDAGIVSAFTEASGIDVTIDWEPTTVILDAIAKGARPDGVLATDGAVSTLVESGLIAQEAVLPIVASRIGLGVRAGASHPDISTVPALIDTLLAARSVSYSLGGQSGLHFGPLLGRLGIADAVNARASCIPAGFTGEKLLTGEADIAVQQISELKAVNGVEVIGPLPDDVQKVTAFSGAPLSGSAATADVTAFLNFLRTATATESLSAFGLDPR